MANDYSAKNSPNSYSLQTVDEIKTDFQPASLAEGLLGQPVPTPQEPTDPQGIADILAKYRQAANELSKFNQETIRQQSLQKVVDYIATQPITDFQRAQTINNIHNISVTRNKSSFHPKPPPPLKPLKKPLMFP
jgi:hypothetical protein